MNAFNYRLIGPATTLHLARMGWTRAIVLALIVVAAVAWLLLVPYWQQQVIARSEELLQLEQKLKTRSLIVLPPPTTSQERLQDFYELLGEQRHVEQQVKTLFAIANQDQLRLKQAEYKPGSDKDGRFATYQITLPLIGSYAAIRQFCQHVLLAMPFASLDNMGFKRESIESPMLEAKLRFTIYLKNSSAPNQLTVATKQEIQP